MHYNPINIKIKVIITTKYLTDTEMITVFSKLKTLKRFTVNCYNPFTGQMQTATCYRGDRKAKLKWDSSNRGAMFEKLTISLIEI